ncbi:MAG: glutamate 5-kinase [Candidatus Omnitrophota bacterium]
MAKEAKKIVVKIGSSVIAPYGKLDSKLVAQIVKDILLVEKKGYRVIVVSSGAIACGLNQLKLRKRPNDIHRLMAISSLGQIILMDVFNAKFKKYRRMCAQVLLTWDDFDIRQRFINIRKTIEKLLMAKAIPIINENDAVSHEEIGIGDNDRLAALVADLIGAEQLIILSDIDGLLDEKKLVKEVVQINDKVKALVKKQDKTHTKGGMDTKLAAATKANLSGITVRIANGREMRVISRIVSGEDIGTLFLPSKEIEKSRKRWIDSKQIKGKIVIDDGAKAALLNKGKSLLAVGIVKVTASFNKGDAVIVVDKEEAALGCGLVNYSSDDLRKSQSKPFSKEVIHRDNFVKIAQDWSYHKNRK